MASKPLQSIFSFISSTIWRQNIENQPITYSPKNGPAPTSRSDPVVEHPISSDKANSIARVETTRKMASGACKVVFSVRQLLLPCPCQQGTFDADAETSSINTTCNLCGHALTEHQSASSPPVAIPIPTPTIDPFNCPRPDTVAAIWAQLQAVRVMHVRGTPASGKSTLAMFLEQYVKSVVENQIPVYRFRWTPGTLSTSTSYNKLLNHFTEQTIPFDWIEMGALIIIDEAQLSYEFYDLWHGLIKILAAGAGAGPFIITFASYGSATQSPLLSEISASPVHFTSDQRISIRPLTLNNPQVGLYLTRSEFDDVASRFCKQYTKHGERFLPSAEVLQYMWDFSNGHPGGIRTLLDLLAHSPNLRQQQKDSLIITLRDVMGALDDDAFFTHQLAHGPQGFKRGLPTRRTLQERGDIVKLFEDMLVFDYLDGDPTASDALNYCHKMGWVQAEMLSEDRQVYVFPTKMHKRFLQILLCKQLPAFPNDRFAQVEDLCFEAIGKFSVLSLRSYGSCLGAGAIVQPVEAQYQNEFYRSCYIILNYNVYLTSEWSATPTSGRADFHIPLVGWTIECVRDGDRLEEHIARFKKGGRYHGAIVSGQTKQYILLDFRTSMPKKSREDIPFLYHVVFSGNFAEYTVYKANLDKKLATVTLLEQ